MTTSQEETPIKRDEHGAYRRVSRSSTNEQVYAVPCEIEMSSELYEAIRIGFDHAIQFRYGSIEAFVQDRFIERMQQILSDPTEFGKFMLDDFIHSHGLQNACDITSD